MKKDALVVYSRGRIFLICLFSLMMIVSFLNIFLEENRIMNSFYFLGTFGLLATVGRIAFASMGKIQLEDQYLLVFKNFKRHRFLASSVSLYFGKRNIVTGGGYEYPLFIVGNVVSVEGKTQETTVKLVGSKSKNRQLQTFYQEVLQGKVKPLPDEESWRINLVYQLEVVSEK